MSKVPSRLKTMPKNKRQPVVKEFRSAWHSEEFVRSIDHLNYHQAQRIGQPIYKALSQELYEKGCTMAADLFNCLVLKERKLFGLAVTRMHVKDNPELLLKLHENVMLAEKAAKLKHCGGMLACLKILYQTLKLLESQSEEFQWLVKDLHSLFVDIAERYAKKDPACNEIKAHLYCSYALFFAKQTDQLEKCVYNFNKSLELCRGANWPAPIDNKDLRHYKSFHEFVAINFARIVVNYASPFTHTNPDIGMKIVPKAILAISEVDQPSDSSIQNQVLLCECLVLKIRLLVEQKKYEEALMHIEQTDNRVDIQMGNDFMSLKCELFLLKGRCFSHLDEFDNAIVQFKNSLLISERYDLPLLRGLALIRIGEMYAKQGYKFKAIKAFEESKLVFSEHYDPVQRRRAVYGLARILANDIFPNFIKVLKSSNKFCGLYALRKWKYLHVTPWEMSLLESDYDLDDPTPSHVSRGDLAEQYRSLLELKHISRTDLIEQYRSTLQLQHKGSTGLIEEYRSIRTSDEIDLTKDWGEMESGSQNVMVEQYNRRSMRSSNEIHLTTDWDEIESDSQSDFTDIDCLLNEN